MNLRYVVFCLSALLLAAAVGTAPVLAQTRVGEAAIVKNEVIRVNACRQQPDQCRRRLAARRDRAHRPRQRDAAGDGRQHQSVARSQFDLTLDRTVFDDEHTYRDIAVRLTTGAFRFVTGHSEKKAYTITTSVATIGVRGTILDILAQRGKTTVVLQEGASSVCTLSFQCVELTLSGETAVITSTGGKTTIKKTSSSPWNFAAACAAAAGLCTTTDYADATPPVAPPVAPPVDDGLCGR